MKNYFNKSTKLNYITGVLAENLVLNYFKNRQWILLHQRFRCPFGEIDLIVQRDDCILFIEVKKRKNLNTALFSLSEKQKQRLIRSANYYLDLYNPDHIENIQFDYIVLDSKNHIEHIENITAY